MCATVCHSAESMVILCYSAGMGWSTTCWDGLKYNMILSCLKQSKSWMSISSYLEVFEIKPTPQLLENNPTFVITDKILHPLNHPLIPILAFEIYCVSFLCQSAILSFCSKNNIQLQLLIRKVCFICGLIRFWYCIMLKFMSCSLCTYKLRILKTDKFIESFTRNSKTSCWLLEVV